MSLTNGSAGIDQIFSRGDTLTRYFQTGGTWKHDRLTAEYLIGDARSSYSTEQFRTSFSENYGAANMNVEPNGLWAYTFPAGSNFNLYNPAAYVTLNQPDAAKAVTGGGTNINSIPAYTQAQQPLLTNSQPQLTYTPGVTNTEERTAKADFTLALPESIPFFTRFKTGFNFRDTRYESWGGGGYQVSTNPIVWANTALVRSTLSGCQDTPGSLGAGGNKCQYGFVPSNAYASQSSGTVTVTPAQLQDIIGQSLVGNVTNTAFFNGAKGEFGGAVTNWPNIDVRKLFALSGVPNANMNCIYSCVGTDGNTYQQPVTRMSERSEAAYVMSDFNFDHIPFTNRSLPFGWELEGNLGYRYVRTKVHGVGIMKFESITRTAAFDPANPNAAGGVNDVTVQTNTAVDATTHDFLPIYNLAMWLVPDQVVLRYNHARTVARPGASKLIPSGTCTYDETRLDANGNPLEPMTCTTVGNPALRAQTNINQNLSAEWYPNKDTLFSAAVYRQVGKVGAPVVDSIGGTSPFAGSGLVDPVTGVSLAGIPFSFTTYVNGQPATRTGVEFSAKTALTFLPSYLRFTGVDANVTRQHSNQTRVAWDLLSGDVLPPQGEARYSFNWALWYDDGKWQARMAVQTVGAKFNCIAPCGGSLAGYSLNAYPNAILGWKYPAYNPGSPYYNDRTSYVDGKISYRVNKQLDFFVEGRNLTNQTQTTSLGSAPYADGTPNLQKYYYAGRRITIGLNYRIQ
jgi:TonB-dependent receptor